MTVVSNAQHCNIHMWPLFYGYIFCIDGVGNQMHSKFVWTLCCRLISNDPFYVAVWLRQDLLFMSLIFYALTEGTPFAGGIFRMRLVLGKDFPAVPPKGYFLTKIFHPNVGHKGEICVNVLKRDWKAELGLRHVLLVRCVSTLNVRLCFHVYPYSWSLLPPPLHRQSSVFSSIPTRSPPSTRRPGGYS